jgi:uncharacterized membrane protein HdeD (DUF308 family)
MPEPRQLRHTYTRVMSILMIVLGVVMLAVTLSSGGSPAATGILLGVLFIAAGVARLYIQNRGR